MKKAQNIVLFLSVLLFIGLAYISRFNVYQTDDYFCSYAARKLGLVQCFIDTYTTWGGRYFGYSLNMFNPVFYDSKNIVPKIYPVFLMLSFIGVSALNFKEYFNYSTKEYLKKGFLLFFFYTMLLVSLPEHYFWITGSNIYFVPVILSGILLWFFKKYEDSKQKIWFYLSSLLIIILMGSNEILALIIEGILILSYYQKRNRENLFLMMLGTVFLLVCFLAPGNFNRMGEVENGMVKWLKRIALLGADTAYVGLKVIAVLPLFIKVFEEDLKKITTQITCKKSALFWYVSFLPLLFTSYILTSIARQFESILFYFLLTSSLLLYFKFERIKRFWWVSLLIVFLPEIKVFPAKYSYFNIDFNGENIVKELLTTDLNEYEREMNERINNIKNSSQDSVVVDKIKEVPRVLYMDEMASVKEQETYVNDQLQKYFNKKYIRTKE
ncbi:DUF6056 family protein [Chryseobacterium sp. RU33C]|uniref:DUF6056 family protein n=1 Tax=Chryseobacterium sp. RU33C TaxID=1907398 RepID=UPI00095699AF|nr:DUF6056 family protein [Chryseobacterium sp. RU33C]SIQ29883.1 hypothetical protein SAMN05880573_104104 [Chryseobacterium sp. RU33C]